MRLLADRARARPARRRDRRRAARAAPGPGDRLARPAPGHAGAGRARRARAPRVAGCWPASRAHIESEAGEHDLHVFQAIRRMDEILVANFMVFHDLVDGGAATTSSSPTRAGTSTTSCTRTRSSSAAAYAWLTDFVGWLPMPDGGAAEAALTADYNAEMVEQIARYPRLRDRSIFVGNPDDLVDDPLGPGPAHACATGRPAHFAFAGLRHRLRRRWPTGTALRARARLPARRARLRGRRRRVRGRRAAAAARRRRVPARRGARPRAADGRGHRPADRPGRRCPRRRASRSAATCPDLHRAAGRVRRRGGAGRADHDDGARGRAAARSSTSRCAHHFEQQVHVPHRLGAVPGRAAHGLRRRRPGARSPRRSLRELDRPVDYRPVRDRRRPPAAAACSPSCSERPAPAPAGGWPWSSRRRGPRGRPPRSPPGRPRPPRRTPGPSPSPGCAPRSRRGRAGPPGRP